MDEKLKVALGWLREYTSMTNKIENLVHSLEVVSPKLTQMETSIETVPAEEAAAAIAAFKSAAKDAKQVRDVLNMSESFRQTCLENLLEFEEVCISTIFEMRTLVHLKLEYEWKVAIFICPGCENKGDVASLASKHQIQIIENPNYEMGATSAAATSSHASSYKIALLGAAGEIGEPLALLIKMSPWVSALHLYDTKDVKGVAADLSHCNTPAQVLDFTGASELANSLKGVDVVVISAQVPNIGMLSMMAHDDLFNINASIVKNLVKAVADNCPEALIHIISNSVNSTVPLAAEVLKQKGVYNPKKLFGVTTLDVVRANTFVAHEKNLKPIDVDVPVVGGHAGITILPLLSKRKPSVNLTDQEVENLTAKIQNAGTEVVEAKGGDGSATLSMAYAAARFIESSLRALDGDGDVYECSYVESDLTELTFFASRVKLGRNGVEALVPFDLQGLTEHEQKALEALKPELKASIENGIAFANKNAVTA